MIKPPCKNCEKRHPGCHGKCEAYIAYKDKRAVAYRLERDRRAMEHPDIWHTYAPYQPMHREKTFIDKDVKDDK